MPTVIGLAQPISGHTRWRSGNGNVREITGCRFRVPTSNSDQRDEGRGISRCAGLRQLRSVAVATKSLLSSSSTAAAS